MNRAFSLVELSIVLVILGLLTGGILAGQSLIRASELRAVSTEYQRFHTAMYAFRDRYFAMPGDFNDGTKVWGRQVNAVHCVTRSSAAVATNGTCDGQNNNLLTPAGAASESGEQFQFWRQLALAGLIEGTYSGLAGAGGLGDFTSENAPVSKIANGRWALPYWDNSPAVTGGYYAYNFGNYLSIGGVSVGYWPFGTTVFTPEEAWNIDTKLDDGQPGRGKAMSNVGCSDAASVSDFAAGYNLDLASKTCMLMFPRVF